MSNEPANTLNDKYLRLFGIPLSVRGFTLSQMAVFFAGGGICGGNMRITLVFTALVWEFSRMIILRTRRFPDLPQTKKRILWVLFLIILFMGVWQAINAWAIVAIGLASVAGAYGAIYFFGQYKNDLQKVKKALNIHV